ncbi:MAG TPA: hypothetical protein VJZ91_18490 [Blastocatellia bacterium]|nr:hypothetical protein [Blastocatellia bacterium]
MPIIQHGLDAQGRPRWVRERFDPSFYTVPPDWIAKLRSDGRRPSVYELIDNDRGGPLDGMYAARETVRDGKRFVVVFAGNTSPQFAVEIELDAYIADAEIRALPPEAAWEIARELDARSVPPIDLMPEPMRVIYDAARERRVVIFRRDEDRSFGYEEQHFSPQSWVRDMLQRTPDAEQRNPKLWERAWQPSGKDPATRHETAEQALAEARANVAWLAEHLPSGGDTGTTEEDAEIKPGTNETKRLEVKTRGLQFAMLVLLGLFMVPLGALLLIGELSKGSRLSPARLAVGFAPLAAYGAVAWLFRRAHVRSVKYFSDGGLVRNDGRGFAWAELSRVVNRIRLNRVTGVKYIWRTEIQFKSGDAAWLLPTKIGNFREVYELVGSLPCEHTEVRA